MCAKQSQAIVPMARPNVSYTRLMEQEVFQLIEDMCISSIAKNTGLTCRIVFQMICYRVKQALVQMDLSDVRILYVDEASSKKGHNYITVVSDQNKRIIFMCEGKDSKTMDKLKDWLLEHKGDPGPPSNQIALMISPDVPPVPTLMCHCIRCNRTIPSYHEYVYRGRCWIPGRGTATWIMSRGKAIATSAVHRSNRMPGGLPISHVIMIMRQ